jgi:hypothetical protein
MTLCWFRTRCWLWYEVARYRGLSKGYFGMILGVRMGLWIVCKSTSCTEWDSGQIGKVSEVWCGIERYLIYEVMLESAKDQFYGVDTLGQHVPPYVQYGMAC